MTDGLTEKEGSTGHQLLKSDLLLGIFCFTCEGIIDPSHVIFFCGGIDFDSSYKSEELVISCQKKITETLHAPTVEASSILQTG